MEQLVLFPHGRANHDPESHNPICLCGARGIIDPMWDRFYCPTDGIWLDGLSGECLCSNCVNERKNCTDPDNPNYNYTMEDLKDDWEIDWMDPEELFI
jgi:hypothetical protein